MGDRSAAPPVTDAGLALRPGRAPLNLLDLTDTRVTPAGRAAFRQAHTNIMVVP